MRNILKFVALMVVSGSALAAPFTLSKAIRCNGDQSECSIQTSRLTIGDRIGFFNSYNELVARGVVRSIKGEERIVKITDRYSKIERNYRVDFVSKSEKYKMIESEDSLRVGAAFGMATYQVSGSTRAYEFTGYGAWSNELFGIELPKGLSVVGRGSFLTGSRDLSRDGEEETFSMMGFGLLGGVAFESFRHTPVTLRGEVSLGGSYTSLDLGAVDLADEDEQDFWNIDMNDGFNVLLRGEIDLLYNGFDKWHPFLGASITLHGATRGQTIWLGLVRDLK